MSSSAHVCLHWHTHTIAELLHHWGWAMFHVCIFANNQDSTHIVTQCSYQHTHIHSDTYQHAGLTRTRAWFGQTCDWALTLSLLGQGLNLEHQTHSWILSRACASVGSVPDSTYLESKALGQNDYYCVCVSVLTSALKHYQCLDRFSSWPSLMSLCTGCSFTSNWLNELNLPWIKEQLSTQAQPEQLISSHKFHSSTAAGNHTRSTAAPHHTVTR